MTRSASYNERLFSGSGLRSYFHLARFNWTRSVVASFGLDPIRLIEIGCFDGRLIDYMPAPIEIYAGYDAGWEGGLEAGQARYSGRDNFSFIQATDPAPMALHGEGSFNVGAALETIEHIPPQLVEPYLEELARVVDGYLVVTVPNEKGLVFFGKYLAKKLIYGGTEPYTLGEIAAATLGQMDRIERSEHKGFDYAALVRQIDRHFEVVKVSGLPFACLPPALSFTVGIVAKSRQSSGTSGPPA
jgi:hypothetical protein